MAIVEVAIPVPLQQTFDYQSAEAIAAGQRVRVPFGRKKVVGVVLANKEKSTFKQLKAIEEVLDEEPILDQSTLDFLKWSAQYYHHPIGEVISAAMPKNLRLGKPAKIKKTFGLPTQSTPAEFNTTTEQAQAIDSILASMGSYHGFLLHGVTGSGKTEVYLNIAQQVLNKGQQVLVLVPEIGLTPQMVSRFEDRLEANIVAIHSQLNETQKLDAYLLAKNAEADVVLGTRSAIFAPMPNLGLIIVDEEHDQSFKQQSSFRYNARDLSFIRAKQAQVPLVLGSATPSLESLKNVMDAKLTRLKLTERASGALMPKLNLIDMRSNFDGALSKTLIEKIKRNLDAGKQVMLFINRRGYAPIFYCKQCSWKASCTSCEQPMVYHRNIHRLRCHHCAKESLPMSTCPECSSHELEVLGYGTERLEETLESFFPDVDIIRIDRDTTRKKKAFSQHLEKINSGKPCLIIGTQMLAKGHDFSNLSMVGILDVDIGLMSLDFRATEHLSQLLVQVSGRAGRAKDQGEVVIQTRYPEHQMFNYVLNNQYTKYASVLLKQRMSSAMPPFAHQALICANAKHKQNAEDFLQQVSALVDSINLEQVSCWGPAPATIEKKADYYYFNLYLQSADRAALHQMLSTLNQHITTLSLINKVRWYLDVDPIE